ncbi:hypothetical protein ANO14919_052790 [Xylariales sp. No.14919]|nr:hypothetical protein ANO14919_052790 [Xylariales sp. No.14919]
MEIPSRYSPREPGGPPPAIYIEDSGRFDRSGRFGQRPHASNFSPSSIPMSIPNNRRIAEDDAPPPLPPPKYLPGMGLPGPPNHDRIPSIDSNASWDSSRRDSESDHLRFRKQEVGRPHQRDEGYHSMNSTFSSIGSQDSLPKKLFMSHNIQFNKSAASDYDNHQLKKLDSRRVFDNRSPPRRSGLAMSLDQSRPEPSQYPNVPQLSLPVRLNNRPPIDPPSRFTDSPLQTTSPRVTSYYQAPGPEYRSPVESIDADRSPRYRARRNNSDDATMSTHSSYENIEDTDFPMEETSGIRRLHIDDTHGRFDSQSAGQKRRASSPPGGDSPPQGPLGSNDPSRRRDGVGRGSPAPRLSLVPPSSLSSVSSAGRSASYVSTASLNTNLSSLNSFGGRSPSGLSSGGLSPVDMMAANSPYNTPISLGHPSCAPFGRGPHQRNISSENRQLASPRKVVEVPKATISKLQGGFFMCECCPKKPKKFETAEELSAHEAEKQYECSFCGNRFKNKNEAERHQNSLHVRRHSWSCSALLMSGFDRAFHESTNRPGEADTCGYCGEEFGRSGGAARARHATDRDWDLRLKHLQEAHKFRECNSSKKFYRADHFRQHLKHSHAGTSGKWTNMLENACMLDEEPPQPPR